jgi:hypothetical protein
VSNVNLTFDDDAAAPLAIGTNPTSGTYKPTDAEPNDILPGAAPAGPYATSLSVLEGTNPLGTWSLYVADDAAGDVGSLTGWCVRFVESINAGAVANLRLPHRNTITWDPAPHATSYNVYRGHNATLAGLANGSIDSCLVAANQVYPSWSPLPEVPEGGSFYWYLVRGVNARGEGPAGFARFGTLAVARVLDSSGSCP